MNPELIEKLKKLLNMAKGGSGNESDIALEKAQAIAAEHDIDLAVVALHEDAPKTKPEMVKGKVEHAKRLPIFSRYSHWILEKHFNVKLVLHGDRYHGRYVFVLGDKPDVEFVIYVKSFIEEDMQRRWDYYYKSSDGSVQLRLKSTWAYSVWRGLDQKLKDAKQSAVKNKIASMPEPIRGSVENKYALLVMDKESQVKDFLKTLYPKLGKPTGSHLNVDHTREDVKSDGYRTGLSMNINRPLAGQKSLE